MRYILNIGLNIPGTNRTMPSELALAAVRGMLAKGESVRASKVYSSDTEPTLVVAIEGWPPASSELDYLCELLLQDCVAYVKADANGQPILTTGELIGPKAAEWGPFNPAYFLLPDGTRAGPLAREFVNGVCAHCGRDYGDDVPAVCSDDCPAEEGRAAG